MPMGYPGFARYAISLGAKGEVDELVGKLCEDFKYYYENEIKLKPFVKEYLEKLKDEGIHCHVLTGSPHTLVDGCLKNNGVWDIFENVWSVDDFGMMKSNPELYKTVADRLGVSLSDILFFDDNYNVIKTCRDVGLSNVAVYDITTEEYKDDIKAIADKYINSFEELL
jgi:HAD superfamily hydrolase (TIGR01509 family)